MKWKRLIACLLAIALCLMTVACGKTGGDTTSFQPVPETTSSVTTVITTTTTTTTKATTTTTRPSTTTTKATTTAPPTTTTKAATGSTPLLYRVTDEDGLTCYLFGSVHVGETSFYPLPDYVMDALEECELLSVEFDILEYEGSPAAQMECLQKYVYTDGTTIRDHVSKETYEAAKKILLDNEQYTEDMDYYMPVMWADIIDSLLYDKLYVKSSLGVDRYLIRQAKGQGIHVTDIESAQEQTAIMVGFSPALQEWLLCSSIEAYGEPDAQGAAIKKLQSAWAKGNESEMKALINEEATFANAEEQALYEEYNKAMMTDRDDKMTQHVAFLLENVYKGFVCVGAAHVLGEGGIIDQLRARGYKVELVR